MIPNRHPAVDEDWRQSAACADYDPENWYPDERTDKTFARIVCQECPVRTACLEDGLEDEWGMWGGYTPTERARLRKYLPTEPIARRLTLVRAAYLGPAHFGVADTGHPLRTKGRQCPSPE